MAESSGTHAHKWYRGQLGRSAVDSAEPAPEVICDEICRVGTDLRERCGERCNHSKTVRVRPSTQRTSVCDDKTAKEDTNSANEKPEPVPRIPSILIQPKDGPLMERELLLQPKRRARGRQARPVEKLCGRTGEVVARFPSVGAAAASCQVTHSAISKCLNGRAATAAGCYAWRYIDLALRYDRSPSSPPYKKLKLTSHKAVHMICLKTGKVLRTYDSMKMASDCHHISSSAVGNVCHGRARSAGGFGWKLAEKDSVIEAMKRTDEYALNMTKKDSLGTSKNDVPSQTENPAPSLTSKDVAKLVEKAIRKPPEKAEKTYLTLTMTLDPKLMDKSVPGLTAKATPCPTKSQSSPTTEPVSSYVTSLTAEPVPSYVPSVTTEPVPSLKTELVPSHVQSLSGEAIPSSVSSSIPCLMKSQASLTKELVPSYIPCLAKSQTSVAKKPSPSPVPSSVQNPMKKLAPKLMVKVSPSHVFCSVTNVTKGHTSLTKKSAPSLAKNQTIRRHYMWA